MSSPLDLSLFPDLPPEVVKAFAAMPFELTVERAARQHEQAVVAEKDAFISELKELIEKLEGQVHDYRRTKFGPKSEKLDPAQMELALEDLETAIAETQARIAAVEKKIEASASDPDKAAPRKERKARALPEYLPRVERVIEPDSIVSLRLRQYGADRRRSDGTARPGPGTLRGNRHDPPEIRLPQGSNGRHPGQSASASAGRELADGSPSG